MGVFEFVALAALRAVQLTRGCTPAVEAGDHKSTVVARMEIAARHVRRVSESDVAPGAVERHDDGA